MRVFSFDCDTSQISKNQNVLADQFRSAVYQKDKSFFELLDFSNDRAFLEPSLFCYFLSELNENSKIPIQQCLLGYLHNDKVPSKAVIRVDSFGLANLPNLGYLRGNSAKSVEVDMRDLKTMLIPNIYVKDSLIRLCLHPTDHLFFNNQVKLIESTEQTFLSNKVPLLQACQFLQANLSEFWKLVELVTREFVIFNSNTYNSFAGIIQHGTAYFNTENRSQTHIFFIDDIAHQCGHIIFNALTLKTEEFLKVHRDTPLKNFTNQKNDNRNIYGAFHGLFTYTCILYVLDEAFVQVPDLTLKHEALGRIGFYMEKFWIDLQLMNNPLILTEMGLLYHSQFMRSYKMLFEKYHINLSKLDYSNQPYTFQYDLFQSLNNIDSSPLIKQY